MDEAIVDYMRRRHNLLIGDRTAEQLKMDIGSARTKGISLTSEVYGRSLVSGLPRSVNVTSEELDEALEDCLHDLIGGVRRTLGNTLPELANDIFEAGIRISGGGALLVGLDRLMTSELGIQVTLADEPDLCVAHGLEAILNDPDAYDNIDLYTDRQWNRKA